MPAAFTADRPICIIPSGCPEIYSMACGWIMTGLAQCLRNLHPPPFGIELGLSCITINISVWTDEVRKGLHFGAGAKKSCVLKTFLDDLYARGGL